jgi:hypothetical protein
VNVCESVINVVNTNQPNNADRLEPKGKWSGRGIVTFPSGDRSTTGGQLAPNPLTSDTWNLVSPYSRLGRETTKDNAQARKP